MNCDWQQVGEGVVCRRCGWQAQASFQKECEPLGPPPNLAVAPVPNQFLTSDEIQELFPDPTLIGNRLAAITTAIGIPPCSGCGSRRDWLNRAHLWLKSFAA